MKAGEETVTVSLRMTKAQRKNLAQLGGAKWVREHIDALSFQGFQVVPVDPTDGMLKAANSMYESDALGVMSAWPSDIYRAMLAAARRSENIA